MRLPHRHLFVPLAGLLLSFIGFSKVSAAGITGPCANFYSAGFTLAQGQLAIAAPAVAKPAKGVPLTDPVGKTCVVRATDHAADGVPGMAVPDYSRREPFNADDTRFIVQASDGSWHLYDANTLKHIETLNGPSGDPEAQWSPTDPNTLYFMQNDGGLQIKALNITTNTSTVAADFTGKLPWANAAHCWTKSEGSPSRDGRYWGMQCEDASFNILGFIVWDLVGNKLVGSTNISTRPDNTSMSPSGRWLVSNGYEGVFAYSPDFKTKKQLYTTTEHSDIAIGANGDDIWVSIDYSGNGYVFMVDIDTGVRTDLFPTYVNGSTSAMHISGKAFAKPGWVLISAYAGAPSRDGTTPWFEERVFAVQLAANPQIYPIAAHRSTPYNGYWTEPHAAPNRSFTRMLFASSWLTGSSTDIDSYMVQLPDGVIGGATAPPAATVPTAGFSAAANGLTVAFTDTSTDSGGSIVTRSWNFGDGSTSAVANPSHTYAAAGSYSVVLTVTDSGGVTATSTQIVKVTAPAVVTKPTAAFTASANGLTVAFSDTSTDSGGSIVTRSWNFGDGTTSAVANSSHTYAAAGSYSVVLTVTDSGGVTATSTQTVKVTAPAVVTKPTAAFTASANGLTVAFSDTSTDSGGSIVTRSWSFGDGSNSTATNPTHAYAAAGTYAVTLVVTDSGGLQATSVQSVAVKAPAPPPPSAPLVATGGPCANAYAAGFALNPGELIVAAAAFPQPSKAAILTDPAFGTCVVRATDHVADGVPGYAVNDLSRRQAFNADNSRFIVSASDGNWYLYDATTLQKLKALKGPTGDAEPQWHATDPNTLYYLPSQGGTKLYALNISTDVSSVAADFSGKLPWTNVAHVWTHGGGSPSQDGRYWAFQVEDASFNILGYAIWDLVANKLVSSNAATTRPDFVSMSPSGRWFVSSSSDGVFAWSTDFSTKKALHTHTENADLAMAKNGDDTYVSIDYQSAGGSVFMVDLDTGARINLFSTYLNGSTTSLNFSGSGYGKPGWVLISAYAGTHSRDGSTPWFEERLFALQLAASPRVYELGAHRSMYKGELTQPQAVASRDFTRVLFNSNWLSPSATNMDAYMIQLPAGAIVDGSSAANTTLPPRYTPPPPGPHGRTGT